jgi:hypothetical protein
MLWPLTFADPIPQSDGGEPRTLRDAGNFIAKLPKCEHDAALHPHFEPTIRID